MLVSQLDDVRLNDMHMDDVHMDDVHIQAVRQAPSLSMVLEDLRQKALLVSRFSSEYHLMLRPYNGLSSIVLDVARYKIS